MKDSKRKAKTDVPEIELVEDAWPRFEKFIKEIVKAGPQHRKPLKTKKQRKRVQMITDDERIEIRRKLIDRLLPKANGMDRFRYIYGSHDEVLWYGLNEFLD